MSRPHGSTVSLAGYEQIPAQRPPKGNYRWFAVLCVIALLTASLHENVQIRMTNNEPNFNFFLFSQQTSSGFCTGHTNCVTSQIRPFWTIHGLWPSNDTAWPENCNRTVRFDATVLDPIRPDLEKFWPSVISIKDVYFWHHEWQKHGSCAMNVPALSGVFNYFNSTLNLLRVYNVSNFLLDDNIEPSTTRTYTVNEILKALKEDLSTKANIVCHKVAGFAYPVLSEVRFCLSKTTLEPIDCKLKHENCGNSQIFYIPMEVHPKNLDLWSQSVFEFFKWYVRYMSPV